MQWLPILFYLGIAAWQVGTRYEDFFPSSRALDQCSMANYRFDPRDAGARQACIKNSRAEPSHFLNKRAEPSHPLNKANTLISIR